MQKLLELPPPSSTDGHVILTAFRLNREQQLGGGLRGVRTDIAQRQQEMAAQMANWPTYLL